MATKTAAGPAASNEAGSQAKPAGKSQPEAVEPLIPHASRAEVDQTPGPQHHEPKAGPVEPMIPHKNRREME